MSKASQLCERLETFQSISINIEEAVSPQYQTNPVTTKDWVAHYLYHALRSLDYQRHAQYSSGGILGVNFPTPPPTIREQHDALGYLTHKGVFTPTKHIPHGLRGGAPMVAFRVDFEKAVAFFRMVVGEDPDFLTRFPDFDSSARFPHPRTGPRLPIPQLHSLHIPIPQVPYP